MILVIGGAFQGKTDFVIEKLRIPPEKILKKSLSFLFLFLKENNQKKYFIEKGKFNDTDYWRGFSGKNGLCY